MSLTQLEAFLDQAQRDPRLQEPLANAADAAAVAAIATAAGFDISAEDLLMAAGEPLEVFELDLVTTPLETPQAHLDAFLQRVEVDPDLQKVLATAADAEAVAAIARIAGYGITAEDLWQASDESPLVLDVIAYGLINAEGEPDHAAAKQAGIAALESFLVQAQVDPDLQQALAQAEDAVAVANIAQAAGYGVAEQDLWLASDESPEALRQPKLDDALEPAAGAGA
jgi:predicted ribosomally synthesized peptide with nif11-like leader